MTKEISKPMKSNTRDPSKKQRLFIHRNSKNEFYYSFKRNYKDTFIEEAFSENDAFLIVQKKNNNGRII